MSARAVCIEIGGGGIQTAIFDGAPEPEFRDGAVPVAGAPLMIAVPGIVSGGRVIAASNLGWFDVDPLEQLGLPGPALVVANDAEAAALGEVALRDEDDLAYLGLGTGIGGTIVRGGVVVEREAFGHRGRYSERVCSCGQTGCLETVAAGWALPDPLTAEDIARAADALARAIEASDAPELIVVAGGLARSYPALVEAVRDRLPSRRVEGTRAPAEAKSASAWGLLRLAGLSPAPAPAPPRTAGR